MDELAKRFADLADKYGPNVADAALGAARTEAYSQLVAGTFAIAFAAATFYAAKVLWVRWTKENWDEMTVMPFGGLILVGCVVATVGIWAWVDPWTWTTINHPELWIAKKAFRL